MNHYDIILGTDLHSALASLGVISFAKLAPLLLISVEKLGENFIQENKGENNCNGYS